MSFRPPGHDGARFGLVSTDGAGVIDVTDRSPYHSVRHLLAAEALGDLTGLGSAPADHALEDVEFLRPVVDPGKIFCIGVNYGGRDAEYAEGEAKSKPSVFVRFPDSLTGHDRAILRPPESEQLDYEGEIVVVIGRPGRRIEQAAARDHIAGLTVGNEGTIRDWVRHARFNVTQGKNWERSGSVGPWITTIDEIGDLGALTVETRVNGEVRQYDSTASMQYPIDFQIAYLSTFCTLMPGDLVFTGTPTGAGARLDPPVWLRPGDRVEVEVGGVGTLVNHVADEGARAASPEVTG